MRILHLSGSKHHWSGNEQQLADLIRNLKPLGVENFIFCYEGSAIEKYAKKNKIPTVSQPRKSIYSSALGKNLRRAIEEFKIDAIHAHTSNFLTVYVLADLRFGLHTPTVFSRKGMTEHTNLLSRYKYNYKGIDKIICVTNAGKASLQSHLKPKNYPKLQTIYDGISVDETKGEPPFDICSTFGIDENLFLVGNIANHVDAKDLPTFVEAVNYLVNTLNCQGVHFFQVGDKTDEITPRLEAMIEEYGLASYITFAGKVAHAKYLMPQFDLFMMSSKSEGLPLTIYEAFLNKKPVVTTNAGGIAEAITHRETGMMCEIGDFASLAHFIRELMKDEYLKEHLAQNAYRMLMKRFTAQECAKQTKELYQEIINKRR